MTERFLPTSRRSGEVTRILDDPGLADRREVLDRLLPIVYEELRVLARARLRGERPDHSLGATALVHEAYLRLLGADGRTWNDRRHFFRAAAQAMRRLLIDYARSRKQEKRGGGGIRVTLGDPPGRTGLPLDDILALDEALVRLAEQDARMAEVVSLRFFAGLSVEETATALSLSDRTVKREWAVARAWLFEALRDPDGEGR